MLFDIRTVTFRQVMLAYFADHGAKNDWWEERNLNRANEKFAIWIFAKLPSTEIDSLIIPHYEEEDVIISPESGAPLAEVYQKYRKEGSNWKQFTERIEKHKKSIQKWGFSPVFLCQEPLTLGTSYSNSTKFKDMLTHLEGFDRLMALMDMEKKPPYISAYIAVDRSFEEKYYSQFQSNSQ